MAKRSQPHWDIPERSSFSKLKLYNSLTRQKEEFVPQNGNRVLWYSCGPTVYDSSHLGHARSYISFDILRRVLSDYFSYDVFYVMNITDIDDKIIKRARQRHLFNVYAEQKKDLDNVLSDIHSAVDHFKGMINATDDIEKKGMLEKLLKNTEEAVQNAKNDQSSQASSEVLQNLFAKSSDVLSEWLDKEKGETVNNNRIFDALPDEFEEAFHEDMESLNVLPPDAVTRVREFIPEIISYVETIMKNGFAYESNGSVYFDTMKFNETTGHFYAKLVPEAFGDVKKLNEGEGDLSISSDRLCEKHSTSDFALWKSSKPGEPSWDSPWGKGRPGWHIECSVMASTLLGESLDIHTGGFDLKFPHHDNELAQAEAYFGNNHWVRYFLHSGHLTISGLKMSKSLKNFITIKEALKHHTARQIRLAFLLHSWKDTLDYSDRTLNIALHYERTVKEFFLNVKDTVRDISKSGKAFFTKWETDERNLHAIFHKKQDAVHEALCDNIDTRSALESILELITESNKYIQKKSNGQSSRKLLMDIMSYISKMLKIFGADFGDSRFEASSDDATVKMDENSLMPYLKVLAKFREDIRQKAKELKVSPILTICDELRDDTLPSLGVRLEDKEGQDAAIKLVNPKDLIAEKEHKRKMEEQKKLEKDRQKQIQEEIKAAKEAEKKIPPSEMFKAMKKYSKFNEKGIPTHDEEGKELTDSQLKKVIKQYNLQEKKYNNYLKTSSVT